MKLFPKGTWRYAVLLVILFSIAAIATWQVIDFTTERFLQMEYERAARGFSLAIWSLTMGLMFLAGALGLLAISATAEYESRYRIARIVNRMNYLPDGLLALDYQGRVKGANPAARKIAPIHMAIGKKDMIGNIFPSLTEEDTRRLLNRNSPCEIECEYLHSRLAGSAERSSGSRILRLRSQPVEGLILVLVSDITEMHAANVRQQQSARLQLLGRIASGVAHDFSNILSAISGHAALMQRFSGDKHSLDDAIGVVMNETQRGVRLSRQLLALSRSSDFDGQASDNLAENVREAGELLRVALSSAWTVETEITGVFPMVPLAPPQIVQIVLNLGLLAADALKKPGRLLIQVKPPDSFDLPRHASGLGNASPGQTESLIYQNYHRFAAIITILAAVEPGSALENSDQGVEPQLPAVAMGMIDTIGVIPSVVRALVEEAGGRLDEPYVGSAKSLYRICLPYASKIKKSSLMPINSTRKEPFRIKSWPGRQWHILLATSDAGFAWLEKTFVDLGAVVEKKSAIDAVLGAIDSGRKPDVIIADKRLFGDEADRLLKAVRKISPASGIIIISPRPEEEELRNERGFVFLEPDSGKDAWLDAVVTSMQTAAPQK